MAVLKFRVYWEEDDAIYRDVLVKHTQNFQDLHTIILKAFEFDQKHDATFYRSNDIWKRGREISKEVYDREYKVPPLLMAETAISSEIIDTNQHFIYEYDFVKSWSFLIELIQVIKNADADMNLEYPLVSRIEGVGPMQYGTKGLLGEKFADIEEKYDLNEAAEGFGEEGEDAHASDEEDADASDDREEDADASDEGEDADDNKQDNESGSGFFEGEAF
ncbi:MAG: plasmid pRiA4b ORF-3 family protein [Chitinophagaceae bacterium]|nr:plasmid pRiA4b ORF-3 family protein [Chitinophagaceae bacterium]